MTNRLTNHPREEIPETPYISGMFRFKGHDSYCYLTDYSSVTGGRGHD